LKAKSPQSRQAIDAMLEKILRPARPPQIKGNSSLVYDESTERDFADIMEVAEKTLLEITLKAIP
jgi:hypothetical protein